MLVGIVAVVVLAAIFVVGALVGSSVMTNHAGDRDRRRRRDLNLTDLRTGVPRSTTTAAIPTQQVPSRAVRTRDVVGHATRV